jgi:hypothetical protein
MTAPDTPTDSTNKPTPKPSTEVATRPRLNRGNTKKGKNPSGGKGAVRTKVDWEAVKATYIEGFEGSDEDTRTWPTLQEVAKHHGLLPETVRKHSATERWPEQRASYQARIAHTRRQRRIMSLSKEAIEFDGRALQAAKMGMTMVQARLGEIARDVQAQQLRRQEAERRIQQGLVIDPDDFRTVIDARELNTLGQAAQSFQSLAAKALGEDVVRHEVTGADGAPMEIDVTTGVTDELLRDDPERMVAVMEAMARLGFTNDNDIIDATLEEEDEDGPED